MNILYFSNLSTNVAAGLNWSVPATIEAQSVIDNVFWVNLTNTEMPHWKKVKAFHNANEFCERGFDIDKLPVPFNRPDVAVFEGFYQPNAPKIAKKLLKLGIPYIITPRGSLTFQAQHNSLIKRLKKSIANFFIFKPFTKNAIALQYLTVAEQNDSGDKWNRTSFVVPNGFHIPDLKKQKFSSNGLKAVFIGRMDLYHKGLDILLEACNQEREFLSSEGFKLYIHGPQSYDYEKIKNYILQNKLESFVILKDEVTGKDKEVALIDADIFILTSRFEGHPMGLIEALAYGLPSLVTPGSNMGDVISNYNAGWLAEPTAQSIAEKLKSIIENINQLPSKSDNARRLSFNYDWSVIATSFHKYVASLLKVPE